MLPNPGLRASTTGLRAWSLLALLALAPALGCGGSGGEADTADSGTTDTAVVDWRGSATPVGNPRIGAYVWTNRRSLYEPRVLGAVPARRADDGSWTRQCAAGPADGVLLPLVLGGTKVLECWGSGPEPDGSIAPGDVLDEVAIQVVIFDAGCPGPTAFDGAPEGCELLALATVYCGPAKVFQASDFAFDPARLTSGRLGGEPVALPDGVTEGDVTTWLADNALPLTNAIAERVGVEGDGRPARVVAGAEPSDPDLTAADLALGLGCSDPISGDAASCPLAGEVTVDAAAYVARAPSREAPHDVVLLVDQSGSTSGLVDAGAGDREADFDTFSVPPNFGELASDPRNARLEAARTFLRVLHDQDRATVLAFSADGDRVPCGPDGDAVVSDPAAALARCFEAEPDLSSLAGIGQGRANLWEAVATAHDFLAADTSGDPAATKDIIIVSDGPDTCRGENLPPCAAPCSDVGAAQVLATLAADQASPSGPKIRVHIVQFESDGYPGPDPRQMEVACASGGTYRFVASNAVSGMAHPDALENALTDALVGVRLALRGAWEIAVAVPAGEGAVGVYGATGQLTVAANAGFASSDVSADLGPTSAIAAEPVVRYPCAGDADCGGAGGACLAVCSTETLTCAPEGGLTLPDGAACVGEDGVCCGGACQTDACASCL